MTIVARAAVGLTQALSLLYPSSFRHDVGQALVADVRRRAQELPAWRAPFWLLRLATSLVGNLIGAWLDRAALSLIDLKLAFRMLLKYPGLTLVCGLGIAVAVTIGVGFFALCESRFFPDVPLPDGDRLVALQNWDSRTGREERRATQDFAVWRGEVKSVQDLMAFRTVMRNVIDDNGDVELVSIAEMTPSGFDLARVAPIIGRTLVDSDAIPGAPPVVVIGAKVWRTRFASAAGVVGRALRLGTTTHTIVGVMPDAFAFPVNHRFWIPLIDAGQTGPADSQPSIFIGGRLAPGVDLDAANAELSVIGRRMAAEFPETHAHLRPEVLPYTYQFTGMTGTSSRGFWPMVVIASLLLVVVCVNVAILIYARTVSRLGEIAVRTALGATRGRIVAQLFAEALVLSAVAAAAGFAVVESVLDWARRTVFVTGAANFWDDYTLSLDGVIYGAVLVLISSLITGVVPALRATGRKVHADLRQVSRASSGLRMGRTWTMLIVVQVSVAAVAVPLAMSLGAFQIRDYFRVPRFDTEQFLFMRLALDRQQSTRSLDTLKAELAHRLASEPGVIDLSFMNDLPANGSDEEIRFEDGDDPAAKHSVSESSVDDGFFQTFGLTLLAGRAFAAGDRVARAPDVVVVNRAFVERVAAGREVLGRRISDVPDGPDAGNAPVRWHQIVGVVENIDANPLGRDLVDARVYHPLESGGSRVSLAVHVAGTDLGSFGRRVRQMAVSLDPTLEVEVEPLRQYYQFLRTVLTQAAIGLGAALLSVLMLAAAGIYALMSFTVARRRREIAIRTALGATPGRLIGAIFRQAVWQISLGVATGVAVTLFIDYQTGGEALRGREWLLLTGTSVFMSVVGVLAALGPARSGLKIAPLEALRGE